MIRLWAILAVYLLSPSPTWSATYWASVAGGETVCANVDGTSDPGVYMTPAQMVISGCMASGDTVTFKAGTYTTLINWTALLPSGTSEAYTTAVCEGNQTCIIKSEPPTSSAWGVVTLGTSVRQYIQFGSNGNGFEVDGTNCSVHRCQGIYIYANSLSSSNLPGFKIIGNHIFHHHSNGIGIARDGTNAAPTDVVIEYNTIDAADTPTYTGGGPPHTIYVKSHGATIRHNTLTAIGAETGGNQFVVHCYLPCNNVNISRNILKVSDGNAGVVLQQGGSNTVAFNVIKETSGTVDSCIVIGAGTGNNGIYNNLCHGTTEFIRVNTGGGNNTFSNNICITGSSCTITNSGGTLTQNTNSASASAANFRDPATFDYSLVSGAATLINSGTSVGYSCNGTCDIGPFETFTFTSCEIQAGATSTIRATFTNNLNPPLLPATGATTFTARKNVGSNTVSGSVDRVGDGIVDIPVTNSYAGGDTVDISWASGNVTDSALIGGTVNQPYVGTLTNQSCTNNAAGAPAHTFTQAAYELHDWLGGEDVPVILPYGFASDGEAENFTNYKVRKGGKIRIRLSIVCGGANCPPTAFNLYRSTGGAYSALTDSFGVSGGFKFCGEVVGAPTNGGPTTNQLSTAGTFVPGGIMYTASAVPTISGLNTGYKTELEYCVDVRDTASTGNVDFRVYQQDGTALNAHTVTPRIVIDEISAGAN